MYLSEETYDDLIKRIEALEKKKIKVDDIPMDDLTAALSTSPEFKGNELLLKKSITSALLKDDAVGPDALATDAVTADAIAADAVGIPERAIVPNCRVYNSANISVANSTWTAITFDSERTDDDAMHDTSTNKDRITIPTGKDGLYLIIFSIVWASGLGARRLARIRKNGSTTLATTEVANITGGNPSFQVATLAELVAGDYVHPEGWQDSGGNLNVSASAQSSPEFMAVWLSK